MDDIIEIAASTSQENDVKRKSQVWNCFTEETNEAGKYAKCNICDKKFEMKRGNTTNLWSHLEKNHVSEYSKYSKSQATKPKVMRDGNIQLALSKLMPYDRKSPEYKKKTEAIVKYICGDSKPLSTIDSPRFRAMLSVLDPRYQPPCRTTISEQHIPGMYQKLRDSVLTALSSAKNSCLPMFSFTTDGWSSITTEPYLSLTVHIVDSKFVMRRYTLETRYVPEQKTGVNLAIIIAELLESWSLEKTDVACITTDSASNMIKMAEEGEFIRLPCFGHLLHNGIKTAMKQLTTMECTRKLREIVAYFHASHRRQLKLNSELKSSGKKPLHLLSDCPTRWGSTYQMYSQVLENLPEIKRVLVEDAARLVPTPDEEAIVRTVVEALKDYQYMTDGLSGDNASTSGAVLPMLQLLGKLRYQNISPPARVIRNEVYNYVSQK